MKLFGQFVSTAVNVVVLPVQVAKDVVTLGGVATDNRSATLRQLEKIKEEASE